MSTIGVLRQFIAGQATAEQLISKLEQDAQTGALDALEALENLGSAFLTKFAPAETQALASAGASLLTGTNSATVGANLLSSTVANAKSAAESSLASGAN